MECTRYVPRLTLQMGNYSLIDHFFVVDILNTNVVLGVQWFYMLGKVTTDWKQLEMEFKGPDGRSVLLGGINSYSPQTVLAHRMQADQRHGDIEWAVELRIFEVGSRAKATHPDILALLERHQRVFGDVPPGRPLDRGFEHTI